MTTIPTQRQIRREKSPVSNRLLVTIDLIFSLHFSVNCALSLHFQKLAVATHLPMVHVDQRNKSPTFVEDTI